MRTYPERRVRVLSLDGGGMRGLVTALLLQKIEQQRTGFLEAADVFAGTSSGGVLALALASANAGGRLAKLEQYIKLWDKHNFSSNTASGYVNAVAGIGPTYSNEEMKAGLTELFGDTTRLDELPTHAIIPTFQLDNGNVRGTGERTWRPNVYHTFKTTRRLDTDWDQDDDDWFSEGPEPVTLLDLAMRTTAVPVVLPIYQGFLDGGVYATNPSMCAISLLMQYVPPLRPRSLEQAEARANLERITLLSVGAGRYPTYVSGGDLSWGTAQWLMNLGHPLGLLDLFFGAGIDVVEMQAKGLLGKSQYHRLDPTLAGPYWTITPATAETIRWLRETVKNVAFRQRKADPKTDDLDNTLIWLDDAKWL